MDSFVTSAVQCGKGFSSRQLKNKKKMSESQTKAGNQEKLKKFENLKILKIWNF